jgi:tetratricopeptide (TPR) repeat protein
MKLKIGASGFLLTTIFSAQLSAADLMAKADSLFEQRNAAYNAKNNLADNANINQSISLYNKIITTSTDAQVKQEAAWKVLQAYFFKALFTTTDADEKVKIFSEAVAIGEKAVDESPQSVAVNCWFGIVLGYLGEVDSKLNSLRNGIPGRVKKQAEKVIALDENFLDGGGYRMYGRLHFIVPNVPLVMGWPSKKKSVEYLEKACKIAPENLFNKLYLAEILLDQKQTERAVKILQSIVNAKEIRHDIAIDTFIKRQAKLLLEKASPLKK